MQINRKFRRLFRIDNDSRDVERAVDDELVFHFEMAVRDLVARGATEADARKEAERRFGDVERTRSSLTTLDHARVRESRRAEWWSSVLQDLQYAVRGMRRKPAFTVAVVTILALGIGANATMFGIVDRLLLRPPSRLAHPERVQRLYFATIQSGKPSFVGYTSYLRFHDVTDSSATIEAAAGYANPSLAVGTTEPRELRVTYATAGFWRMFDVRPVIGRFFAASEDIPGSAANVVVLNYDYWQSAFGGDAGVLGKQLRIGRLDYTVIGVAPQRFSGFADRTPVAFVPLASGGENSFQGNGSTHWYSAYGLNWMSVIVRRKPGATVAAATAELSTRYVRSYEEARKTNPGAANVATAKPNVVVAPVLTARGPNQGTDVKVSVWLVGVAFIVLVIACANVSNLLLARAFKRKREIAVRLALGISRSRLFLQLLVESVLLAMLGGVAGLAVTEWGGRVLRSALLPNMPATGTLTDGRTVLFTAAVALMVGVLAGFAPALRAGQNNLAGALKAGSREGTYQRSRLRTTLLVLQSALSVVLLVGAGLFVRSLNNVQGVRLGYDAEHLAFVEPQMRGVKLDSVAQNTLYNEMLRTALAAPGTRNAALAAMVPFESQWNAALFVPGIDSVNNLGNFLAQVVSPTYFETMGTRIVRGRALNRDDRLGATRSVVVSEAMARKLWPNREALGQCVRMDADTIPCSYVVGIAEDIKYTDLANEESFQYYLPRDQYWSGQDGIFVRTKGPAAESVELLRRELQRVMPGSSYVTVRTMSSVLEPVRRSWRLGATMFTLFGMLALLVASVGLYSVIAYSVTQRTQEMGVRVALGAQRNHLLRLVMGGAVGSAMVAVVLGAGVALLASKWVAPLLFETSPRDPLVYGGVAVTLLVVAFAAGIGPALRASRVSPGVALRAD